MLLIYNMKTESAAGSVIKAPPKRVNFQGHIKRKRKRKKGKKEKKKDLLLHRAQIHRVGDNVVVIHNITLRNLLKKRFRVLLVVDELIQNLMIHPKKFLPKEEEKK